MRGIYARFRCCEIPTVLELSVWCGPDFVACTYADIRGGVMVELAGRGISWPCHRVDELEMYDVHAVEFFEDSLRAAGGVSVHGAVIADDPDEPQTAKWRAAMGFLTHVLDDVDVSHPRGVHASSEFHAFVNA